MKRINQIVQSPTTPDRKDVLWIDTLSSKTPTLKIWTNDGFTSIGGGGSSSGATIVSINQIPSGGLKPNVPYLWENTMTGTVEMSFAEPEDPSTESIYHLVFKTGSPAPSILWPSLKWLNETIPEIEANTTYELSIYGNLAVLGAFNAITN